MNNDYMKLKEFWNKSFILTEEAKKEIEEYNPNTEYEILAPSQKLINACKELANKELVLDYGAGFGFASIIMAKNGCNNIIAFDTSANAKDLAMYYANYFKIENKINYIVSDENWLNKEPSNKYDGIFCSNVLDVLPIDISKNIIKELYRISKNDALIIIGLNYYVEPDKIPLVDGKKTNCIYIDGILRLTSLSDSEWLDLFNDYFELIKLEFFAWPGEEKESRRLFYLKKK